MQTLAADFLNEVDAFLARSGMTATAFGRAAVSDPNFVADIRGGRAPSLRLVQRVKDFICAQKASAHSSEAAE